MKFPITETTMKAMYSMLREIPPFSKWGLPPKGSVTFLTFKTKESVKRRGTLLGEYGHFYPGGNKGKRHGIRINKGCNFHELLSVMGHEMVHLKQEVSGTLVKGECHDKNFRRMASQVCKQLGLNKKDF